MIIARSVWGWAPATQTRVYFNTFVAGVTGSGTGADVVVGGTEVAAESWRGRLHGVPAGWLDQSPRRRDLALAFIGVLALLLLLAFLPGLAPHLVDVVLEILELGIAVLQT